jgi:hypothetical protein
MSKLRGDIHQKKGRMRDAMKRFFGRKKGMTPIAEQKSEAIHNPDVPADTTSIAEQKSEAIHNPDVWADTETKKVRSTFP